MNMPLLEIQPRTLKFVGKILKCYHSVAVVYGSVVLGGYCPEAFSN